MHLVAPEMMMSTISSTRAAHLVLINPLNVCHAFNFCYFYKNCIVLHVNTPPDSAKLCNCLLCKLPGLDCVKRTEKESRNKKHGHVSQCGSGKKNVYVYG